MSNLAVAHDKLQARALRQRGQRIALFLNACLDAPAASVSPIAELITLTQKIVEFGRRRRDPKIGFDCEDVEQLESWKKKITAIARHYPFCLAFAGLDARHPDIPFFEYVVPWLEDAVASEETYTLKDWYELTRAGAQGRICRCRLATCRRYFYAERPHHVFHDVRCKEKQKSQSDGFKASRAERVLKSRIDEAVRCSSRSRLIAAGYSDTHRRSRCPDPGCLVEIQWWTRPRAEKWKEIPLREALRGLATHWPHESRKRNR